MKLYYIENVPRIIAQLERALRDELSPENFDGSEDNDDV
jgi:hypothetical protein